MSPRDYARNQPPVRLFMPLRVRDYYLKMQKGDMNMAEKAKANTVFVQVVDRPARKLILKRGKKATGTSEYVMGVEMPSDYSEPVPKGYEIMDLKPCKMMVFHGPPYDDCNYQEAIGDLWELIKTYNPEIYGFA
jgi:AraC family transcriptional regulator